MLDYVTGVDTDPRQIVIDAELVVRGSTDNGAVQRCGTAPIVSSDRSR
jgi:hypothetical protein